MAFKTQSYVLIGEAVAIIHVALFVFTLSHSPAEQPDPFYDIALGILGAPLMYLRYVPPFSPGRYDVAKIWGLAGANAIFWGATVSVALSRWERRAKT